MNKNEIISILKLLEDPDEKVYKIVKDKIMQNADFFKIYLENYFSLSSNSLAINRSENILDEIFWENFENRFEKFLYDKSSKLAEGVFLLEEYFNKDIDIDEIKTKYQEIKNSIWIECNDNLTSIEKIKIVNTILFEKLNFNKLNTTEIKPEFSSLTYCLTNKKYLAQNITLLYAMLVQQLEIPIYPLNIFTLNILGYFNKEADIDIFNHFDEKPVFYIYPFEHGAIISEEIILKNTPDTKIFDYYNKNLKEIKTLPFILFLFEYFNFRIKSLDEKSESFCVKYSKKIEQLFINSL